MTRARRTPHDPSMSAHATLSPFLPDPNGSNGISDLQITLQIRELMLQLGPYRSELVQLLLDALFSSRFAPVVHLHVHLRACHTHLGMLPCPACLLLRERGNEGGERWEGVRGKQRVKRHLLFTLHTAPLLVTRLPHSRLPAPNCKKVTLCRCVGRNGGAPRSTLGRRPHHLRRTAPGRTGFPSSRQTCQSWTRSGCPYHPWEGGGAGGDRRSRGWEDAGGVAVAEGAGGVGSLVGNGCRRAHSDAIRAGPISDRVVKPVALRSGGKAWR